MDAWLASQPADNWAGLRVADQPRFPELPYLGGRVLADADPESGEQGRGCMAAVGWAGVQALRCGFDRACRCAPCAPSQRQRAGKVGLGRTPCVLCMLCARAEILPEDRLVYVQPNFRWRMMRLLARRCVSCCAPLRGRGLLLGV